MEKTLPGETMDQNTIEKKLLEPAWNATTQEFEVNAQQKRNHVCFGCTARLNHLPCGEYPSYIDYMKANMTTKYLSDSLHFDPKLVEVLNAFHPIPLSKFKKQDHSDTYVIPDVADHMAAEIQKSLNTDSYITLNYSQARVTSLVSFWVKKAKSIVNISNMPSEAQRGAALQQTRYIILGKPGVGKTAFINYIFSKHSDDLERDKIIVIRVDLSDSSETHLNLEHKLNSKFLRIFATDYLNRYKEFDSQFIRSFRDYLVKQLRDYAHPSSKTEEDLLVLQVSNFINVLNKLRSDQSLRLTSPEAWTVNGVDPTYGHLAASRLLEYLQRTHGYGYIFIYDGLDSVSIDHVRYSIYKSWLSQIKGATDNYHNRYTALYIVTMRDYSYIKAYADVVLFNAKQPFIRCRISPVSSEKILKRRFTYCSSNSKKSGNICGEQEVRILYNNIKKSLHMLLFPNIEYDNGKVLNQLQCTTNDNIRLEFRFIRELLLVIGTALGRNAYSLLTNQGHEAETIEKLKRKKWHLYRVLLYGSANDPVYTNKIIYNQEGEIDIVSRNKSVIPNIFNFRDVVNDTDECLSSYALAKIRIIQYLTKVSNSPAYINDVIEWVSKFFRYSKDALRYETREMIYSGVIEPQLREEDLINANRNYKISVTGLGSFIIDRMLGESGYFEAVCDDTPINENFCTGIQRLSRFDTATSLSNYLIVKSKSVICFTLYLMALEEFQEARFDSIVKDYKLDLSYAPFQIFTPEIIANLRGTIATYLSAYLNRGGPDSAGKFCREWEQHFGLINEDRSQL